MYMYEIVSWPLLITAALCFTTQGCAVPAPGWPVVLNYCSEAELRNSGKSAKIPRNSVEILSTTSLYNIFETISAIGAIYLL